MWAIRAAIGLCACVPGACAPEPTRQAEPAGDAPQSATATGTSGQLVIADSMTLATMPEPLEIGPIEYFDNHCASCHGGNGSLYARPFIAPADELPHIVEEMCAGPGMAPLEGRPLEALVDYHLAIRDDRPFVALIGRDESGLIFETTPGVHLIVVNGSATSVGIDTWRVEPSGEFSLASENGVIRYRFPALAEKAWSAGEAIFTGSRYGPF